MQIFQKNARSLNKQFSQIANFIRDQKIRVMNLSWGHSSLSFKAHHAKVLREQMQILLQACPDTLFIAGAGNSNSDLYETHFWPANLNTTVPNLLAVGAVDQFGIITHFSNYAAQMDVYVLWR